MEELARLEEERGTPGYLTESRTVGSSTVQDAVGKGKRKEQGLSLQADEERKKERIASSEMCNFLILNISSLQLIPVNMIAYRSQYGSAKPAAVIAPAIAATLVSTLAAVVYCKIKDRSGCKGGKPV